MTPIFAAHGSPGYSDADYYELIDGRPRFDGVQAALASRGIRLDWGDPDDEPGGPTVCSIGNRKNELFEELLGSGDLAAFPGTVELLRWLTSADVLMAVVSSSRNAGSVLDALGISDFFEVVVDGNLAASCSLPGKPDPATFRHAARVLGVLPEQAVVVEDAVFGVAAGRSGGFGLVVGVDRGAGRATLIGAGADLVLADLAGLRAVWEPASGDHRVG
jgi:HAD superfamily hydrolase (TIGR01509 family)